MQKRMREQTTALECEGEKNKMGSGHWFFGERNYFQFKGGCACRRVGG